ncbi:Mannosylfructose-phosphate synthase [Roseivivax jejudonensis]|uniref:Mannosylfructose-phosphate synthase n=1 Tax=Roseivivax jejudonensis TaxID=1529041 RepID=A0A1X6Y4J5_9RHOB|nr:glycosyltransferase family 4 protein [Roseivivax jejudonensis]SLN10152.1 Mannosylfructose-phosphate synthase [Roseivivax jejudonensis]
MLRIVHLIDDTNPGGVTRYLDFIAADAAMARLATHVVVPVSRTRPATAPIEADVIVSHLTVSWRGLPGLMLLRARFPNTPLVHVEHSYCAGFAAARVTAPGRFQTLLRCAYALFDRVVAVSAAQADWLVRRGLVAPSVLEMIRPCVALDAFRALPVPGGSVRTIGAIGRFDQQKGFDLLIRAFRAVSDPDLRLQLIGDGPERAALETLAAGDPRISLPGFAADPAMAMSGCDLVAMPSRWEPYGLIALEAMAARRPLLVANVDGLKDHIANGAVAVEEMTVEAWASAIVRARAGMRMPATDMSAEAACVDGWARLVADLLDRATEADVARRTGRAEVGLA